MQNWNWDIVDPNENFVITAFFKENPNIRKIFFLHFQVRRLMVMIRGLSLNKEKSSKEQEIIVGNVASGWVPVRNPKSKVYIYFLGLL